MLLENEAFLQQLQGMFQQCAEHGSVWITLKRRECACPEWGVACCLRAMLTAIKRWCAALCCGGRLQWSAKGPRGRRRTRVW